MHPDKESCNLCIQSLTGIDTYLGESTLSKLILGPFEKGSTLKSKDLFPLGTNSFVLE